MSRTYQEFAAENLAGFGWTIDPSSIPDYATCVAALDEIGTWWIALDDRTKGIIGACDLAPGLRDQGMLTHWPGLFSLISGNAFGWYASTHNDIAACLERAKNQVGEQPSDPISDVHQVVGDQPYSPTEP